MGTIKDFEELAIWKMAREITNNVYHDFKECRDFGFRDQIARGSAGEIKNMYYIAEDQSYIHHENALTRRDKSQQLINSISSLIEYLKPSKR